MKKIVQLIDNFVYRFWMLFLMVILGASVVTKAMYNMNDSPYFVNTQGIDLILIFVAVIFYLFIFKKRRFIEEKIPMIALVALFGIIAASFVLLIPIQPISDPIHIVQGALMFAKGDIEGVMASDYLQYIVKNLRVAMFYSIFILPLPKTVISLRMVNVGFYLLTALFAGKTCKNLYADYEKTGFICVASFLPLIFYCNQVYFDLPVLCAGTIALYFYTKDKKVMNLILAALFVTIATYLRVLGGLFAVAMVVDYVFHSIQNKRTVKRKRTWQSILVMVVAVLIIVAVVFIGVNWVGNHLFRREGATGESIWTLFWMGINEPEFGMMHNEGYEGQKTFLDFWELLISRDLTQNLKLFGRKIMWTWTQGTYQCQRYGFGYDVENISGKFIYETPFTHLFPNTGRMIPATLIALCRAQYMALMLLSLVALIKMVGEKSFDKYRVIVYLFFGTFLILILYEMKSRYVLHLSSMMCVIALLGMQSVEECGYSVINWRERNRKTLNRYGTTAIVILLIIGIVYTVIVRQERLERALGAHMETIKSTAFYKPTEYEIKEKFYGTYSRS